MTNLTYIAPNHTRHEWARWDAFISVLNPDDLFQEYSLQDIQFSQPLQDDEDGLRGFEITDVDGYRVFFGRPASPANHLAFLEEA